MNMATYMCLQSSKQNVYIATARIEIQDSTIGLLSPLLAEGSIKQLHLTHV